MERVLYLVHRIPYPPNKGDKVRSFNILKQLAREYEVYLGAFVDDAEDLRHREKLRDWCADMFLQRIHPKWRQLISLRGILTGAPLTVPYYHTSAMSRWVRGKLAAGGIEHAVAFSAAMAQYLPTGNGAITSVVDMVDVDSEKWREYAPRHGWPLGRIYSREARRLLAFERATAKRHDATVFVSPEEAQVFRRLAPEIPTGKVCAIHNGVDAAYFSPDHKHENPYADGAPVIVFTGAMDYWANVDAVQWFADEILPLVLNRAPDARFYVVGARPSPAVKALAQRKGICVTGAVADVRPYLAHACVAVAPLRIARGIQNKVLEAMAMSRPVVATSAAMDGIAITPGLRRLVADDPGSFSERCLALINDSNFPDAGREGRDLVLREYSWEESLAPFSALLRDCGRPGDFGSPSPEATSDSLRWHG